MTTHMIGRLIEVKPIELVDKKTDKVKYSTDLTVMFDGVDEEGYKKVSVETINVDEEYYDELKTKIDKYIAIAYISSVSQYGTRFYPDRSMPVMELDKNPFDYSKFKKENIASKASAK